MNNSSDFQKLPSRIRHYLLEWKDDHLEVYMKLYGEKKLKDMDRAELKVLFITATTRDIAMVFKVK